MVGFGIAAVVVAGGVLELWSRTRSPARRDLRDDPFVQSLIQSMEEIQYGIQVLVAERVVSRVVRPQATDVASLRRAFLTAIADLAEEDEKELAEGAGHRNSEPDRLRDYTFELLVRDDESGTAPTEFAVLCWQAVPRHKVWDDVQRNLVNVPSDSTHVVVVCRWGGREGVYQTSVPAVGDAARDAAVDIGWSQLRGVTPSRRE